jgi:hypothetical protein
MGFGAADATYFTGGFEPAISSCRCRQRRSRGRRSAPAASRIAATTTRQALARGRLPMLGWRDRSLYDTKSTFITLAIDDGADPAVIRDRVTHTKPKRSAFDGYDRGPHWQGTCREVAKLRITRRRGLATSLATVTSIESDFSPLNGSAFDPLHQQSPGALRRAPASRPSRKVG